MRRFGAILFLAVFSVAVLSSVGAAGPPTYGADVTAKPTKVSFGGVKLFSSKSVTVTFTNHSSVTQDWGGYFAPADVSYSNFACSSVVPGGGTCTLDITWTPTAAGRLSGNFQANFTPTGYAPYNAVMIALSGSAH